MENTPKASFMDRWISLISKALPKQTPQPEAPDQRPRVRPDKLRARQQGVPKAFRQYRARYGTRI